MLNLLPSPGTKYRNLSRNNYNSAVYVWSGQLQESRAILGYICVFDLAELNAIEEREMRMTDLSLQEQDV